MSSLYTAVSGIRANQAALDVVSNNIANINTVAFKASGINFQSIFGTTLSGGGAPSGTQGGTNPQQIGSGTAVSQIQQNFSQGSSQYTGNQNDLEISGNGFFTVLNPNAPAGSTNNFYFTRAGDFTKDANGFLIDASGNKVLGTAMVTGDDPTKTGPIHIPNTLTVFKERDASSNVVQTWIDTGSTATTTSSLTLANAGDTVSKDNASLVSYSIGADGSVVASYSNGDRITVQTDPTTGNTREVEVQAAEGTNYAPSNTAHNDGKLTILNGALTPQQMQLRMGNVINPAGLTQVGQNEYTTSPNSGTMTFGVGNYGGIGTIQQGSLESSNVDISQEFTSMIVDQKGLEAASKVVSTESNVMQTIIQMIQ